MNTTWVAAGFVVALLCPTAMAAAEEKEPLAVVALGGAGEWGFPGGKFSRGPSAAVEFSLIKEWVEVEIGGAKLFRRGHSEWEAEAVFRKPFTLSETTEFMIGLGPIWSQAKGESGKMGHHIRGRLHVLVIAREKVWLVRGTKLLRHRQRKFARCERRLSHRYLLMAAAIRLRRKVGRDGVPRLHRFCV